MLYNLVIQDSSCDSDPDNNVWVMSFKCEYKSAQEAEQAVRLAVRDYLETAEGKDAYIYNNRSFNWGDVLVHIPAEFFSRRGLVNSKQVSIESIVSHDEELGGFLENVCDVG